MKPKYDENQDYLKITPYQVNYKRKGEKILKNNIIDYNDLKIQLKKIKYNEFYNSIGGKEAYNERLELSSIPCIGKLFYRLYCDTLKIPTPKGLVNEYVDRYCLKIDDDLYTIKEEFKEVNFNLNFAYNDIAGRILRSYCSFCRELMLLASFSRFKYKLSVYYNFYDDYVKGIDLIIKYNKKKYGIATYIGTKKSKQHRKYKTSNFYKEQSMEIIEMPAYFGKNTVNIGDIAIYEEDYVRFIVLSLD